MIKKKKKKDGFFYGLCVFNCFAEKKRYRKGAEIMIFQRNSVTFINLKDVYALPFTVTSRTDGCERNLQEEVIFV